MNSGEYVPEEGVWCNGEDHSICQHWTCFGILIPLLPGHETLDTSNCLPVPQLPSLENTSGNNVVMCHGETWVYTSGICNTGKREKKASGHSELKILKMGQLWVMEVAELGSRVEVKMKVHEGLEGEEQCLQHECWDKWEWKKSGRTMLSLPGRRPMEFKILTDY